MSGRHVWQDPRTESSDYMVLPYVNIGWKPSKRQTGTMCHVPRCFQQLSCFPTAIERRWPPTMAGIYLQNWSAHDRYFGINVSTKLHRTMGNIYDHIKTLGFSRLGFIEEKERNHITYKAGYHRTKYSYRVRSPTATADHDALLWQFKWSYSAWIVISCHA